MILWSYHTGQIFALAILASLAISLREEDKLCIVNEDEQPARQPQIICSLGLKNN